MSLYCWYGVKSGEQIVLRLEGERVLDILKSPALGWAWGDIHGGCMLKDAARLLLFFNSRTGSLAVNTHRYFIGCAELETAPPFKMLRISTRPILSGEEGYCLDGNKFYKANVMFATGAIREGGKILLAHGRNDHQARIAKLEEQHLNL